MCTPRDVACKASSAVATSHSHISLNFAPLLLIPLQTDIQTLLFPFITLGLHDVVYFSSYELLDFALFRGLRLRLLTKGDDFSHYPTAPAKAPTVTSMYQPLPIWLGLIQRKERLKFPFLSKWEPPLVVSRTDMLRASHTGGGRRIGPIGTRRCHPSS